MPVTTLSAAVHITPVVIKTFLQHSKRKGKKLRDGDHEEVATDDILFDEAFHIVKSFIQLGVENTVESLQAFTNTHVPAPPWAAVAPVTVPLSSCNEAADTLIKWFGPEDLHSVVGGERWWQVRGLDGIEAEWITENAYLSDEIPPSALDRKLSDAEKTVLKMDKLETVMFYVHGGGYFWGSINTHRYQIIRYARKIKGRAFAVNYRKAPQYPWPCPLQDTLAAYLYLINPPKDAVHTAIPPSKIVFAGDSAGAAICLTTLTVLRDMGLPLPAGAVLISPWVDLTHSFPSVMKNTATDIIPPHGFLAKPSVLWPLKPVPGPEGRATTTTSNPPPMPGHADVLKPDPLRQSEENAERLKEVSEGHPGGPSPESRSKVESQAEMEEEAGGIGSDEKLDGQNGAAEDGKKDGHQDSCAQNTPGCMGEKSGDFGSNDASANKAPVNSRGVNGRTTGSSQGEKDDVLLQKTSSTQEAYDVDFWEPKPPKVLMKDSRERPLELRSQIQLYANNEQLTHPLVSPVLQGSLGNLCPLYIIAGDAEVLRDEIIYTAHRAAHPKEYPTRRGVLEQGRRQRENADKYATPTKVHLQVFDGMCHVLTVFTFIDAAHYAYRSIAQFVKHVTGHSAEHLERNPFPELHRPPSHFTLDVPEKGKAAEKKIEKARPTLDTPKEFELYERNREEVTEQVMEDKVDTKSGQPPTKSDLDNDKMDVPGVIMIRERVDIHGKTRALEPPEEIAALQIKPSEVGIIKEEPCRRWLAGQEEWDRRFRRAAEKAVKKKQKYEVKAAKMLASARDQGLKLADDGSVLERMGSERMASETDGDIQQERRWGPLDLEEEKPPASAICKRRDTPEALALLKKNIYHTAPVTHKTVPKAKTSDAIRAAFDPDDHPTKPPRQSVSEQQVRAHTTPMHGLTIWSALIGYFMRESSKKASNGKKRVKAKAKSVHERVASSSNSDSDRC